jgi:hypothetical protein
MKAYGRVDVYIHIFLTSALVGGERLVSRPCRFTPGERAPGTHWVAPRSGLDNMEKRKFFTVPRLELWPLSCQAWTQSLYCLRYPDSWDEYERRKCIVCKDIALLSPLRKRMMQMGILWRSRAVLSNVLMYSGTIYWCLWRCGRHHTTTTTTTNSTSTTTQYYCFYYLILLLLLLLLLLLITKTIIIIIIIK